MIQTFFKAGAARGINNLISWEKLKLAKTSDTMLKQGLIIMSASTPATYSGGSIQTFYVSRRSIQGFSKNNSTHYAGMNDLSYMIGLLLLMNQHSSNF